MPTEVGTSRVPNAALAATTAGHWFYAVGMISGELDALGSSGVQHNQTREFATVANKPTLYTTLLYLLENMQLHC